MIEFEGVSFSYDGRLPILAGLDATFEPGLNLLIGANGCGKSTLLRMAAGIEMPATGRVLVNGHDLWVEELQARSLLAYVPEHPELSPYATIGEVLELVRQLRGEPREAQAEALSWAGLCQLGGRTIRELSKGQRRRVLLAAARLGHVSCLLLDEPLEGLDREFLGSFHAWLDERLDAGATVLLATHRVADFQAAACRAVTLRGGKLEELEVAALRSASPDARR